MSTQWLYYGVALCTHEILSLLAQDKVLVIQWNATRVNRVDQGTRICPSCSPVSKGDEVGTGDIIRQSELT